MANTFSLTQTVTHEKEYLSVESDGCHSDFSQFLPTGNNYDKIDDPRLVPDGDATYVYSDVSATAYDLYILEDTSITAGTINYVKVFSRAKSHALTQSKDGIYKIILTDDACANIYKSNDINITTGYATNSNIWTKNPRTDAAWTVADINNLQIGAECTSPLVSQENTTIFRPSENGDNIEFDHSSRFGGGSNSDMVDEEVQDGYNSMCYNTVNGTFYDLYKIPNHTTETEIISKIVLYSVFSANQTDTFPVAFNNIIKTGGTEFRDEVFAPIDGWSLAASTWTVNPDTTIAWIWNDIDALQIGFEIVDGTIFVRVLTQEYLVVYYIVRKIPEIRTTQMYAMVDYDYEANCSLSKPNEVSTNHSRNIKMLNFWNGEREVYDLERSGKSMILKGVEWEDACTKIQCVRDMGLRSDDVIIAGLAPDCFNGTYKIVSFGWKQVSKTPEVFEWILQVEDCNL